MDTVKKGTELEWEIYNKFKRDIDSGKFFANKECCKVFIQKGYYSKDRESEIIFDVSVEIYLPGHSEYSVLYLIECKNYNSKVQVGNLEEFFAKVQQVGAANAKAVLATSSVFQEGALKFAKSKGIGLLRYFSPERCEWILTREENRRITSTSAESQVFTQALTQEGFISKGYGLYGVAGSSYTNSISTLLLKLIDDIPIEQFSLFKNYQNEINSSISKVQFFEDEYIENMAGSFLAKFQYVSGKVSSIDIETVSHQSYGVKIIKNVSLPKGMLGKIDFQKREISIDDSQCKSEERFRFTLAHELGHLILGHEKYLIVESCYENHLSESPLELSDKDISRLEWQANKFASAVLLPKGSFEKSFALESIRNDLKPRGYGLLYVDNQPCNKMTYYQLTSALMKQYRVSRAVITIRLKALGIMRT